jgi:hypothetical protein
MDVIHVHAEKGGEHSKIKGNIAPKIDDRI